MAWWSKGKRVRRPSFTPKYGHHRAYANRVNKARNHPTARKYRENMKKAPYGYPVRYPKRVRRTNKKYKVVGWTPDYLLSPIDAVPGLGPAAKGYRGYKYTRKSARAAVNTVKGVSRSRRRGRSSSSPSGRRRRRGTYYYYRGKRYYRR